LSESGVRRITEGLTEILQESDALSVTKRMIRRVCFPPTALSSESSLQKLNLKQRHTTYKITSKRLNTKYGSNVIWTDDSAFCKPGIKTKDNEFYSGADTRPEKYGYRLGTKEEALFLHLVQTPKRIVFTLSNSNQTISFPNSSSSLVSTPSTSSVGSPPTSNGSLPVSLPISDWSSFLSDYEQLKQNQEAQNKEILFLKERLLKQEQVIALLFQRLNQVQSNSSNASKSS